MKVSVVGGGLSGLAAAEESEKQGFDTVLYDEKKYHEGRRGSWGEFILDKRVLPEGVEGLKKDVSEAVFSLESKEVVFDLIDGATIDRGKLESSWASKLDSTVVKENCFVDQTKFLDICRKSDLVIDASGPFPVSRRLGIFDHAHKNMIKTLSANYEADFSGFERPLGIPVKERFLWVTPLTENRATVGIAYLKENFPEESVEEFRNKCKKNRIPEPPVEEIKTGTAPSHSSYSSKISAKFEGAEIRLAGNALGLNNYTTGFGIERSIESGRAAVKTYDSGNDFSSEISKINSQIPFQNMFVKRLQSILGFEKTISLLSKFNSKPHVKPVMRPETKIEFIKNII